MFYLIGDVKMQEKISLLDVVALRKDLPDLELYKGQVGTVLEEYEPGVFEVEFSDKEGQIYAMETLQSEQLTVIHRYSKQTNKATAEEYKTEAFEVKFCDKEDRIYAMETLQLLLHRSMSKYKTSPLIISQSKGTSWPSTDEQEQLSSNNRPLLPTS